MVKFFRYSLLLLTLCGCSNSMKYIGDEFIGNESSIEMQEIRLSETYTVKADSFATSTGLNLVYPIKLFTGRFNDLIHSGETVITPTFQVAPEFPPYNIIDDHTSLDSVTFRFYYSGRVWGDTTHPRQQRFDLCQLKEFPLFDENADDYGVFFNIDPIPPIDRVIQSTYFYPTQEGFENIYFKIDGKDPYFAKLFEDMKYNRKLFETLPLSFIEKFKGLAIVPGPKNNVLFEFVSHPDSLYMRFHYHKGENFNGKYDLKLTETVYQYFNAKTTPSATFSALTDQYQKVSIESKGCALIQGLTGYMMKVQLPFPAPQDEYTSLVKAELELIPEIDHNLQIPLPKELAVFRTNNNNEVLEQIKIICKLEEDVDNMDASSYKLDFTKYYEELSNVPPDSDPSNTTTQLLIRVPSLSGTYDRAIIKQLPILRLYYAHYNIR